MTKIFKVTVTIDKAGNYNKSDRRLQSVVNS